MKTMIWSTSSISVTPEERAARRPIGRDREAVQAMLRNYEDMVQWADDYGLDGFASAEHHFQTEGGEIVSNSLLLYAKLAAMTERIMFAPLSIILAAHNPILVAEDLALFSHMFPGRLGVGFARGYQVRWMHTLMQTEGVNPFGPNPEFDKRNREIFNEHLEIVERAWAEDSFRYAGKHFQVPYPATGIPNWDLAEWTRAYGGPDEVDAAGTIHRVGVVPKPLTKPTIFIPSIGSPQTVIDSGRHGRTLLFSGNTENLRHVAGTYRDSAREAGRDLRLGEGMGIVRTIVLGETFDEAFDIATRTTGYWRHNFFQHFGINEALRAADDDPNRPVRLADERALTKRMIEKGELICGTPDKVLEELKQLHKTAGGALDWMVWSFPAQWLPSDEAPEVQRQQLKTYAEHIAPEFR